MRLKPKKKKKNPKRGDENISLFFEENKIYHIEWKTNVLVINISGTVRWDNNYIEWILCSFRCFRILNKSFIFVYDGNMNQLKKFQSFKQRLQLGKYSVHLGTNENYKLLHYSAYFCYYS